MNAQFLDLHAAADFLGPGAIEVNRYQTEIIDIVRRRGAFGQRSGRCRQPGIPRDSSNRRRSIRRQRRRRLSIRATSWRRRQPDAGGAQRAAEGAGFADQLQPVRHGSGRAAKPVCISAGEGSGGLGRRADAYARCCAVERQRHVAGTPTTPQYFGAIGQIEAGGNSTTIATTGSIVDGIKGVIAGMVANSSFEVRPTAIYANPVLLDLIDREMKTEFNVVLSTTEITGGTAVKTLSTQAGDIAPDSGVGAGLHRHAGQRHGGAALLHRHRRHDRVSLADDPIRGCSSWGCRDRWRRRWWW